MRALRHLLLSLILVSAAHAWTGGFGGGGGGGGGSGDVVGPAGATENAAARYSDGTGKVVDDSLLIIQDSGSLNVPDSVVAPTVSVGKVEIYSDSVTGEITAKHGGGATVSLEAGGIAAEFVEEAFTGAGPHTLATAFLGGSSQSTLCINTVCGYQAGTIDYTISGTTLTLNSIPFSLDGSDAILVKYQTQ